MPLPVVDRRPDAYRRRAIELATQAKKEDDPGQRRYLLDLARNMVNVADALAPLPPEKSGQPSDQL
jgi:hypothetical protein